MPEFDAVVVGSGPNGLAAAVRIAQEDRSVLVLEAAEEIGGGARTEPLTLPGFQHDVCAAVHPLGAASPFFRSLPLGDHGLRWIQPPVAAAHPLDDGSAGVLCGSLPETVEHLGADGPRYRKLIAPLVARYEELAEGFLGPLVRMPRDRVVVRLATFGVLPATTLAKTRFKTEKGRALFAGLAAHAIMPLTSPLTSGVGLLFGATAHTYGWPIAEGGSQSITNALAAESDRLGAEVETNRTVESFDDIPSHRVVLFDTSPQALSEIAGDRLGTRYRKRLKGFRRGPGVFKVDYALSEPVPWANEHCGRAGTVHVGGTIDEINAGERMVADGRSPERPFVLVAQPSLFDHTRAPDDQHVLWAYCHVPNGSTEDMTARIDAQIERFAPGFRDVVLARATRDPVGFEAINPNNLGGDISGGMMTIGQTIARPRMLSPDTTTAPGVYLCSASTPPGAGVHGMCGFWAAEAALRSLR